MGGMTDVPAATSTTTVGPCTQRRTVLLALPGIVMLPGIASALPGARAAAIDPDGALVGIVERRGDDIKSIVNMPEEVAG